MTQDIRLIDWEFATQAARRLTPAGPSIAPREVAEAVAELRESARRAHGPVAETTRLHTRPTPPTPSSSTGRRGSTSTRPPSPTSSTPSSPAR